MFFGRSKPLPYKTRYDMNSRPVRAYRVQSTYNLKVTRSKIRQNSYRCIATQCSFSSHPANKKRGISYKVKKQAVPAPYSRAKFDFHLITRIKKRIAYNVKNSDNTELLSEFLIGAFLTLCIIFCNIRQISVYFRTVKAVTYNKVVFYCKK